MTGKPDSLRKPALVAFITMLILLTGSIVFYKERMLFMDATGTIFRTINTKMLLIPENRFGSVVTLWVPYVGTKLHWSLQTIMLLYSASFNLFYLITAAILIFGFRQYRFAILLALYYTLFASDAFFWTNNEVHQGTAWLFLFFATMQYLWSQKSNRALQMIAFIVLGATTIFCHPLMVISTVFLWVFMRIGGWFENLSGKAFAGFSFLLALIISAKIWFSFHQAYDTQLLTKVARQPFQFSWLIIKNSVAGIFARHLLSNYWTAILIFCAGIYALYQQKKFALIGWTVIAAIGFLCISSIVFAGNDNSPSSFFYLEGEWMTLTIIVAAPFVFYCLQRLKSTQTAALLCFVFAVRLIYIGYSAPRFTARITAIENVLDKMRHQHITKALVPKNETFDRKVLVDLELAEESMILSKLHGDQPQITFTDYTPFDLPGKQISDNTFMINFFGPLFYTLNPEYFSIDTTQPYLVDSGELTVSN